jgi:hypothetical protein
VTNPTAEELRGITPLSETALGLLQTELQLQSNWVLNPVCNKFLIKFVFIFTNIRF